MELLVFSRNFWANLTTKKLRLKIYGCFALFFQESKARFWIKKIKIMYAFCAIVTPVGCIHKSHRPIHIMGIEKALNNFHSVEPGVLYRSAQLSPVFLEKIIKKLNIKTIINLRGENPNSRWWRKEQALAQKMGVTFYSIAMRASTFPDKDNLLLLLKLYKQSPKPILIHCYSGADRTGEAAALWILECQKLGKKQALKQLSFKYHHLRFKHPEKRHFIKLWQGKSWFIREYSPEKYEQRRFL